MYRLARSARIWGKSHRIHYARDGRLGAAVALVTLASRRYGGFQPAATRALSPYARLFRFSMRPFISDVFVARQVFDVRRIWGYRQAAFHTTDSPA